MSLFTQWVPAESANKPDTEENDAYADRLIDSYDQVAPGFKASIRIATSSGRTRWSRIRLIGGNIFHGGLSLEQLFHMRPHSGFADYSYADLGSVQRQLGDARRRRRVRHSGVAGREGGVGRKKKSSGGSAAARS